MKHLISLVVFIALAVFAWSSITRYYHQDAQLPGAEARYIELFMNEFEMTTMDADGKPLYILHGASLQRYNDADDSIIQQPVFQLLHAQNQWLVSADSATINDMDETIQLDSNVVMQQQNIEPAVSITTQAMTIHTKTQIASSKVLVTVNKGDSQIKSNGMIFNNASSQLELLSNVNGYFSPDDQH